MTKTRLWFRIETDTESKNGRNFRPDTETNQNHQIFQTIAMSHDSHSQNLLESKNEVKFQKQIKLIQFPRILSHF